MSDFHPKERKAIILFFAFLALGLAYLYTHDLSWENHPKRNPAYESFPEEENKVPPNYSTEKYF
jgi:hypothetical protein